MKRSAVESLLLAAVGSELAGHGFTPVLAEGSLVRLQPWGWQRIGLTVADYAPTFELAPVVRIRWDAAEAIFHMFSGVDARDQGLSSTITTSGTYFGQPEYWEGDDDASLRVAVDNVAAFAVGRVVPFFDRHDSIEAIDRSLNGERTPAFDITAHSDHAQHAVIVARLARNPAFEDLVDDHEHSLRDFIEVDRIGFQRLVAYLRTLPP